MNYFENDEIFSAIFRTKAGTKRQTGQTNTTGIWTNWPHSIHVRRFKLATWTNVCVTDGFGLANESYIVGAWTKKDFCLFNSSQVQRLDWIPSGDRAFEFGLCRCGVDHRWSNDAVGVNRPVFIPLAPSTGPFGFSPIGTGQIYVFVSNCTYFFLSKPRRWIRLIALAHF